MSCFYVYHHMCYDDLISYNSIVYCGNQEGIWLMLWIIVYNMDSKWDLFFGASKVWNCSLDIFKCLFYSMGAE